jgi:hypothetical protein
VPYHDLRTVAAAAGHPLAEPPSIDALTTVRDLSRAELERREIRDCDIAVSDLFDTPQPGDMLTINHPGNRVLIELARRIQTALGTAPDASDPGRTLLGDVLAPVERPALQALGIHDGGRADWQVAGRTISTDTVHATQLAWYREHPGVVAAGRQRHGALMTLLGLD